MTEGPWIAAEAGTHERRYAPATQRNRDAIVAVLRDVLPTRGLMVEVASGSGEHAIHFAHLFPDLMWQPTDPDDAALRSIAAWRSEAEVANVASPLRLDATSADWPVDHADAILCINMVHISPWEATIGLIAGAARLLSLGAPLYLYGPFLRAGIVTASSNLAFDDSLKERDARWGLRSLEQVSALAVEHGFALDRVVEMPANNLSVVYRRTHG